MPQEKSCGFVVYRIEGEAPLYLILHYGEGHWDFAKGHIEIGESGIETAKRELFEETGIEEIAPVPGFVEKIGYFFTHEGKKVHKEVFFFLGETNEKEVKLSDEHVEYEWLEYEKAIEKLTYVNAKNVLQKAHTRVLQVLSQ